MAIGRRTRGVAGSDAETDTGSDGANCEGGEIVKRRVPFSALRFLHLRVLLTIRRASIRIGHALGDAKGNEMMVEKPITFGTVEVAKADVVAGSVYLQLFLRDGVVNRHELGNLIRLLNAKRELLQ